MKTMSCHRTKRSTAKSHLCETPACRRSRSFQGKAQQEQRQLTFGDQKMRGGGRRGEGDGRSTTPRTRRSTRAAKNTRVSYKDVGEAYSSNEDAGGEHTDESDGSVWDEMGLSESDLSEDNRRRRKVRRSLPTRRSKRASTKKRFTSGHDAVSSSEEESDDFINDSETTNASSSSDDYSQEVKQHKNRTRTKSRSRRVTEDMKRESDEDVAVSSSAKKRKKSSAQLVSSDNEEEGQQRRRRRIIVASDSSDSSDDGCTEMNKTEGCAQSERKSEEIGPMSDKTDVKQETSELATSVGNGQPNHQHCTGEKDEESSPKYAAAVRKGADRRRVLSDKGRASVKTKSSDDRKDKSSKSRRARTSSIQDKQQTALERLKRQRDRKKQGINKSMCESDEEEEKEEEKETEVISSESEDSFIVPDDETDEEEDEPEVQEDEDSVGEIVHQEKKTQFQSWVELMLCANLQDNPGEYLRTARFNTDIPDDTRDNVAQVLHRLQDATNLVFSTAWRRSFKEAIEMHPFYSNQPSSHLWMDCQACGRPDHHISQTISLKGTPYDRETFEDDDFGNYEKSYDVGCFCQERSELYHGLYHFRYRVFHTCKAEAEKSLAFLRDEGEEDPDDDKVIDRCLKDPDWIDELFNEMAGLIEDVHQQYTADYSKPWKAV